MAVGFGLTGLSAGKAASTVLLVLVAFLFFGERARSAEMSNGKKLLEQVAVLDLATAVRVALSENPSLSAARARVAQAGEAVRQARSGYWPRVDASLSAARVDLSGNAYQRQADMAGFFGGGVDDPEQYYRAGVTASWLLFDGFVRKFNVMSAQYGERLSAAAEDDARRVLIWSAAGAFLAVQLAQETIVIAEADLAFNQRLLTEARLRCDVGDGALSDVLNFEVKANSAKTLLIQAEQSLKIGMVGLAAVMGLTDTSLPGHIRIAPLEAASDKELTTPVIDRLLDTAYQTRPDLRQNDWAVQQAQAGVSAARGGYYPTLTLSAEYSGERAGDMGFESDDFGNTVGIELSCNLFAGGFYKARHQQAAAQLREMEKSNERLKIDVTAQVRQAFEGVLSARDQLALQRANARLVRENRDLVEKEYKAGVGSLVRLNEAQRDLTAAQARLAAARVALRQAWYDLAAATGEIEQLF